MSKIPDIYKGRYIFHMTHIDNLESILSHGLLCHNECKRQNINYHDIAHQSIQDRRANMTVPCGAGGSVHDYVPFYFSALNPMLLARLNTKSIDQPMMVFIGLKIDALERAGAVFTDASANTTIPPVFFDDLADLDKLSWPLIRNNKWKYSDDERHKKMAEALIPHSVKVEDFDTIVVFNNSVKEYVSQMISRVGCDNIRVDLDNFQPGLHFFFTKFFFPDRTNETLVAGPRFLKGYFEQNITEIHKLRQQERRYRFNDVAELVYAIDNDFCTLKELRGIHNLETDNPSHHESVSDHTKRVAANIQSTAYFLQSSTDRQNLLKLTAYLHDIGKGPKEKWVQNGGKQKIYPDHPADSIPMLKRILSEEIRNISDEDIRLLNLLVIYHDIVGDCMMKGRNTEEIKNLSLSDDDLDALFCIAEADIKSINSLWHSNFMREKDSLIKKL